jgi:hypothetical protein
MIGGDLEVLIRRLVREEITAALRVQPAQEKPALLTCKEVARELGCTSKALRERFRRSRLAGLIHPVEQLAIRTDGVLRWPRSAIADYVASLDKSVSP